jgi:hypothetical protein
MFEKFGQIAERAAFSASRRDFLGRLGRGAMTLAVAAGGMLAATGSAEAAKPVCGKTSRGEPLYPTRCRDGQWLCCPRRMYCYTFGNGGRYCRRGG